MKAIPLALRRPLLLILVATLSLAGNGCSKKERSAAPVSAEKNSFAEVTAHLDPGGSLYLYLGTEQWLAKLSEKISAWRELAATVEPEKRAVVNKGFDLVARLIQHSGVESFSGVGASGIAVEPGFYRTKVMLHHYPGAGGGYLWSLLGAAPHRLDGLDCLPANTAWAWFADCDIAGAWAAIQREIHDAGFPEAEEGLKKFKAEFEQKNGQPLDRLIASFGGEHGVLLTLDPGKKIALPLPAGPLEIPSPGLAIALKVKDDALFDVLERELAKNPGAIRSDKDGVRMRTMPVPTPMDFKLRPTVARSGEWLLLATSDELVQQVLDVKAGRKPGLKSADEFKKLARGLPVEGNQFAFVSPRLGEVVQKIQKSAITLRGGDANWAALFQKLQADNPALSSFAVMSNTKDGWLTTANGNQQPAGMALAPALIVPVAIAAAVAMPAFAKARATAQRPPTNRNRPR